MTDKEYRILMENAERLLAEGNPSKEHALFRLQRAGILDENGDYSSNYPALRAWQAEIKKEAFFIPRFEEDFQKLENEKYHPFQQKSLLN